METERWRVTEVTTRPERVLCTWLWRKGEAGRCQGGQVRCSDGRAEEYGFVVTKRLKQWFPKVDLSKLGEVILIKQDYLSGEFLFIRTGSRVTGTRV